MTWPVYKLLAKKQVSNLQLTLLSNNNMVYRS